MMQALVGTSGWVYKDWAKRFYPPELKGPQKLPYLAKHFPTVEINSTFYRLPSEAAVRNWHDSVPADFVFSVKLSRYLTHQLKLTPGQELADGLDRYCARLRFLGQKLGAVLVQLPPSLRADDDKLVSLLSLMQTMASKYGLKLPTAWEFRHKSWFTPGTMRILRQHNATNVFASGPGRWPESRELTADWAFIRFHGSQSLYASSYSDKELDKWAKFIRHNCADCRRVFCYFNNDKSAKAVENAQYLLNRLGAR